MSDLFVSIIICFQTQKQLATLNNIRILLKGVLIDLYARNFVHMKNSLCALSMHARHCARNLSSPDEKPLRPVILFIDNIFYNCFGRKCFKQAIIVVCLCNLQDRTYSHVYT